jgi:Helix-turn-helix domain
MTTNTEREPFVDAVAAGEFLQLRPRRVLELARRGEIPAYPLGQGKRRVWRFKLSELASALCSRGVHYANAAVRAKENI